MAWKIRKNYRDSMWGLRPPKVPQPPRAPRPPKPPKTPRPPKPIAPPGYEYVWRD